LLDSADWSPYDDGALKGVGTDDPDNRGARARELNSERISAEAEHVRACIVVRASYEDRIEEPDRRNAIACRDVSTTPAGATTTLRPDGDGNGRKSRDRLGHLKGGHVFVGTLDHRGNQSPSEGGTSGQHATRRQDRDRERQGDARHRYSADRAV